jgi:hypothetical protein
MTLAVTLAFFYKQLQATPWLSGSDSWGTKDLRVRIGKNRQFCPAKSTLKKAGIFLRNVSPNTVGIPPSNPYPWFGNLLEAPASQPNAQSLHILQRHMWAMKL